MITEICSARSVERGGSDTVQRLPISNAYVVYNLYSIGVKEMIERIEPTLEPRDTKLDGSKFMDGSVGGAVFEIKVDREGDKLIVVWMGRKVSYTLKDMVMNARSMISSAFVCRVCGKESYDVDGGNGGVELCPECYYDAGLENEHLDGHHEDPRSDCKLCQNWKKYSEGLK